MSYIRKVTVKGRQYLQKVESYRDPDTGKVKRRILKHIGTVQKAGEVEPVAIIWSANHTLGNITIKADNPLIKQIPEGSNTFVDLPCDFVEAGKFRNGKPRWWCRTHQMHFGKKADGDKCGNASIPMDCCRNPFLLDPSEYVGGIAVWAALKPAICTRPNGATEPTGIHVHCRQTVNGKKSIDKTFPALRVKIADPLGFAFDWIDVTPIAAQAWLKANASGLEPTSIRCTYCSTPHLDLDSFATKPHRKHLCGNCGRDFWAQKPITSNPLALLAPYLEKVDRVTELASPSLEIKSSAYPGGLEIWSSTTALVWTTPRPETVGIHVHAYDASGKRVIDETYGSVVLDGQLLDRAELLNQMLSPL